MNAKAEPSTIQDRQRLLRLLVKDVLIGKDHHPAPHPDPGRTSNEPSPTRSGNP
jgi:hypothetical protein